MTPVFKTRELKDNSTLNIFPNPGDHWIGLEIIHLLTRDDSYTLNVDLWDSDGRYLTATYDDFKVGPSRDYYRLSLGPMTTGNVSDALAYHNGQAFSTPDVDNDAATSNNCAKQSKVSRL